MPTEDTPEEELLEIEIDLEGLMNEVIRFVTPNTLRHVRAKTGKGLDELGDMDIEDQLQFVAFARGRIDNPELTWEEAADLAPFGQET